MTEIEQPFNKKPSGGLKTDYSFKLISQGRGGSSLKHNMCARHPCLQIIIFVLFIMVPIIYK